MSTYASLSLVLCFLAGTALAMDQARTELRVDDAIAEFKATGEGVLIAILDRGIDWRNDDFRNDDGSTRIRSIFDLTDKTGANAAVNPYKVGTIYTQQQIDRALKAGAMLTTRDAVGHGTTTTAIACGSGRNSPKRKYQGIAPKASILVVKVTSDGAPAHDGEPAEANFYEPELIPVAMDFVRDKAKELCMPCVMLLNLGSHGGPTDGTSSLCRKIDETVGSGKLGLIFVTGPGDDGGRPNRAGGMVKQGQALTLKVKKEAEKSIFVDLWYNGMDRFDVSLQTPVGRFGPYAAPGDDHASVSESRDDFAYQHNTGRSHSADPGNRTRQIFVELKGPQGDYALILHGKAVKNGRFDATLGPNPGSPSLPPFDRFLTHLVSGSICDGATARNNICPGDYVIRTEWKDMEGHLRTGLNEGKVGELWRGSSTGPTFDGRLGVDFCMPGNTVFTTYNPHSHWATFQGNLIHDGKGLYGGANAVSAAAPMATGVIALMLQLDPKLDAVTAKKILQQAARSDKFTGATPNPAWGYGKLDAYAALKLTKQNAGKR